MLQRVTIGGIELPRLYMAENRADAELAMSKGIPFIRWSQGKDELIRVLLRPVLEKMFPDIKWASVLGPRRRFRTKVEIVETKPEHDLDVRLDQVHMDDMPDDMDETIDLGIYESHDMDDDGTIVETAIAGGSERLFCGGGGEMVVTHKLDLQNYVGDLSSYVDVEVLQRLRLMPAFIGDILDCIRTNVGSGLQWREGYNKRLGLTVGRFDAARQLPNLIILDVSGSIPRGISATMIALIDTLRTQLSADLIITSTHSRFYPMGSELPEPQRIRDMFGFGNEAKEFFGILGREVRGRHYGHVFSFGDNDTPDYFTDFGCRQPSLEGTVVEHVHHYHTGMWLGPDNRQGKTGYAKWCHMLARKPLEDYDQTWCKVIRS